jgi:hypothetical protein
MSFGTNGNTPQYSAWLYMNPRYLSHLSSCLNTKRCGAYLDGLQAEPTGIFVSCTSERTESIGQYFVVSANQKAENTR